MSTALLVIDVQMAFVHDDAQGADRSCPEASDNIQALLDGFRSSGQRVIHIHHHGTDPEDPFHAEAPGAEVQPFAAPKDGEVVYIKHVASGFVGTSLEEDLRAAGVDRLVVCGATANHCAESTTRSAGNLGFDVLYASDAVWTYGVTGPDNRHHSADTVHSVTLSTIHGEFATVMPTEGILAAI